MIAHDVDESFKKICGLVTAYVILEGEAPYVVFIGGTL